MNKQQLHEQLEQLRAALHQMDSPDSTERDILQKVVSDIQDILARPEGHAEHYRGLNERLKDCRCATRGLPSGSNSADEASDRSTGLHGDLDKSLRSPLRPLR